MTSRYPPEKATYRALNADIDEESTQAQGSSSVPRPEAGWTFEQAYMHPQTGEDSPPPPTYDESVAAYHDPQVTQAAQIVQDSAAVREEYSSSSSGTVPHITPFPLPQATVRVAAPRSRPIPLHAAPTARDSPPAVTMPLASIVPVAGANTMSAASTMPAASAAPSPYSAPAPNAVYPPPSWPPPQAAYAPPSGSPPHAAYPPASWPPPQAAYAPSSGSPPHAAYPLPSGPPPRNAPSNVQVADRSLRSSYPLVRTGLPEQQSPYAPMTTRLEATRRPASGSSCSKSSSCSRGSASPLSRPGLRSFAPGASPSQILTPRPPSFSRSVPDDLPYAPFPPCSILSLSGQIEDGFPVVAPAATIQPHPFATHDVNEADWTLFLSHVNTAGSSSALNKVAAGIAPALNVGLVGMFLSMGLEGQMKKRKIAPVVEIIDQWNFNFFHPRQMEITLAQGQERHSGLGNSPPPDVVAAQNGQGGSYPISSLSKSVSFSKGSMSDEDDSSDEDSTSVHSGWQAGHEKKQERKDSAKVRKAERRARKAEKRLARAESGHPKRDMWGGGGDEGSWRLVVSCRQPIL